MFPGLDLYYADPGQPRTAVGEHLENPDRDLSGLCPQRHNKIYLLLLYPRLIFLLRRSYRKVAR